MQELVRLGGSDRTPSLHSPPQRTTSISLQTIGLASRRATLGLFGHLFLAGRASCPLCLQNSERVKGTTGLDVATNGDTARKNACATKAKSRGSGGPGPSAEIRRLRGHLDPRYGSVKGWAR